MNYPDWHNKTVAKIESVSEINMYFKTIFLGIFVFLIFYIYLVLIGARNPINKSVADTGIVLIGMSMLLTSLCYFWDFVDTKIIYRKHLGLVGFVFGMIHVWLSFDGWSTVWRLTVGTGMLATIIFLSMALISNRYAVTVLGGVKWRLWLRTGYVAVILVWLHVYFLKITRIREWVEAGAKTPPSTALLTLIFMTIVIMMRVALWVSLLRKK